jgi:hypothetical protein
MSSLLTIDWLCFVDFFWDEAPITFPSFELEALGPHGLVIADSLNILMLNIWSMPTRIPTSSSPTSRSKWSSAKFWFSSHGFLACCLVRASSSDFFHFRSFNSHRCGAWTDAQHCHLDHVVNFCWRGGGGGGGFVFAGRPLLWSALLGLF